MEPEKRERYPWGELVAALCFGVIAVALVLPYVLR